MVIGQLDLENVSLIARPSETFERPADTVSLNEGGDHPAFEDNANERELLQSVHLTCKVYDFFCYSLEQELHIKLPPGATMKQAREAVAHHYAKPPEAVFLHLCKS
jgi:hypothetical protein